MRAAHLVSSFLFLGACNGAPAPQPVTAVTSPPPPAPATTTSAAPALPPPPAACLPRSAAGIARLGVKDKAIHVCYERAEERAGRDYACIAFDTESRTSSIVPAGTEPPEAPPAPSAYSVETTAQAITVCKSGTKDCATVRPGYRAPNAADKKELTAAVSPDGSKVIVLFGESVGKGPMRVYADTFDVKTSARLSRVPLSGGLGKTWRLFDDPTNVWAVSWPGRWAVATDGSCCGPGAATVLFDPKSGNVKLLHHYQGSLVRVSASAHIALDRKALYFVDVDAGTISGSVSIPGDIESDPEQRIAEIAMVGDEPWVVQAHPPAVTRVDMKRNKLDDGALLPLCR
jgi:hypothetical protein